MKHDQVRKVVETYFATPPFQDKGISVEQLIQLGTHQEIVDVVLHDSNNSYIAIVVCKQFWEVEESAMSKLKGYLSATDTHFGVLAIGNDPGQWIFCENQRNNWFVEIQREAFESRISKWHPNTRDSATIRDLENTIHNLRREIHQGQRDIRTWRSRAVALGIVLIVGCVVLLLNQFLAFIEVWVFLPL